MEVNRVSPPCPAAPAMTVRKDHSSISKDARARLALFTWAAQKQDAEVGRDYPGRGGERAPALPKKLLIPRYTNDDLPRGWVVLARLGGAVKLKIWTYKSRPFDASGGGVVRGAADNGVSGGRGFSGGVTMVHMFPRGSRKCWGGAKANTLRGMLFVSSPHGRPEGAYCCFLGALGRHGPHSSTQ